MKIDQHIVYSEEQKLDVKKWILIPTGIAWIAVALIILLPFLYFYITTGSMVIKDENGKELPLTLLVLIGLAGGLLPTLMIFITRIRMRLVLSVGRMGIHYKYIVLSSKEGFVAWDDVIKIEDTKYPLAATRPGDQFLYLKSGGHGFVLATNRRGIELHLKNGKKFFFTSNQTDELIKAIKKLELNIQITRK